MLVKCIIGKKKKKSFKHFKKFKKKLFAISLINIYKNDQEMALNSI